MRLLALVLSWSLAVPSPAVARSLAAASAASRAAPTRPAARLSALPPIAGALPPLSLPAAAIPAAPPLAVAAAGALPERLAGISRQVSEGAASFAVSSQEQASAASGDHLRLLQGERISSASADAAAPALAKDPAPLPPSGPQKKAVKRMVAGTMAFKLGMEGMTTAVPFLAMASLGGATAVALLVVAVYGTAQALFSSFSGALTDRFPASRVLSVAVAAQGSLVALTLVLGAADLLAPWALFPIYAAIGGAVGIAETTRRLVAPLIMGQNEQALRQYNGRLHRFYEIAGVSGAALAGLLIWKAGALSALIVVPPAALAAAWMFWRVSHARAPRAPAQPAAGTSRAGRWLRSYVGDLRLAGRIVFRDPRLSALALAMVAPQIIHRVFEGLLLPVYAKTMLGQEALSAAMLTASNFGELLGATLLLRLSARFTGPYQWVKWGAYGLLGVWALSVTQALGLSALASVPVLLPLILISSMTWASSHLSLESNLQEKVAPQDQPRVVSLLYGMFVVGAAVASLIVGQLLDALPMSAAFIGINAAFTALAVAVWFKARRLL